MNKVMVLFCFCFCSFLKAKGQQSLPVANTIDSLCTHIDSLTSTKSFERFYFELDRPRIAVGFRLHYIDTTTKLYKKIIFKNDVDTSIKTFYFNRDTLIEIKIEKNDGSNQTAKYQFNNAAVLNSWDPYVLVKDVSRLAPEGRRYYMLVRYSKNTF